MAGKKQHYIPQALLRGFLIRKPGNTLQAVVYKKQQPAYSSSIEDIAAKRYFYSDIPTDSSKSLDDHITDYETRLGALLNDLRSAYDGQHVDPLIAGEVVAHLSIRGAYLRDVFSSGARQLIEGASSGLRDEESARNMLGVDDGDGGSRLSQTIDENLEKLKEHLPEGLPLQLLRRMVQFFVREEFGNLYEQSMPEITEGFRRVTEEVAPGIRQAHASALNGNLVPDKQVAKLATFSWRVLHTTEGVVLPDCVAVGYHKQSALPQPYLLGDIERVERIVLPLAADRVLMGTPQPESEAWSSEGFNEQAARCSSEFFVAFERSESLSELSDCIGSVPREAVARLVEDALENAFSAPIAGARSSAQQAIGESQLALSTGSVSYAVTFKDCATQEQAEHIAAAVAVIVNEFAAFQSLNRLSEIIFATDYPAALGAVDLGFESAVPMQTIDADGLVGMGRTVTVVRDGQRKVVVVLRAGVAHGLLTTEAGEAAPSAHLLTTMLSDVAFQELLENSPVVYERYSAWDSLLYAPMDGAIRGYYSAWFSAEVDPSASDSYREVLVNLIGRANEVISVERLEYGTHADLDRFLRVALDVIGDVLVVAAKLIAHCDARNESIYGDDGALLKVLTDHGLVNWMSLYGRDLRRAFSASGQWQLSELTVLGRHMERHLWRYFVFPWVTEDDVIRVEVPWLGERRFGN